MDPGQFDRMVEELLARVPARFRRRLQNLVIVVEPEPPRGSGLLGLHESMPPFPDKITIYQRPHERASRDQADLERLVEETLLHEIGHYLGMNEAEVLRMERSRRRRLARRQNRPSIKDEAGPG